MYQTWQHQTARLRQDFIRWQGRPVTVTARAAGSGSRKHRSQTGWVAGTTAHGWRFSWSALGPWGATEPTVLTTFFAWADLWASDGRVQVSDPQAMDILTDEIAQTVSAWVAETAHVFGMAHVQLPDGVDVGDPQNEEQEVNLSDGDDRLSASPDRDGSRGLGRPARPAQAPRRAVGRALSVSR